MRIFLAMFFLICLIPAEPKGDVAKDLLSERLLPKNFEVYHIISNSWLIKYIAAGLVSAVYPPDQLVNEAVKLGEKIASKSKVAVQLCKEAINKSYDLSLTEGLRVEKQLFYSTFATNDVQEGMTAFVEKREPRFTDS
ncbi:probable enoyl-CoA hydratase, mitochondrial [Hyalella azteca]|uniref:enoyl-CoA hydratase n=1 Tax=Hyalella azteca TaxID=294128 RepID=A0A979FPC5_HYAAZ|nr:probable enoyl-CoA hydratase, mitochondrial [Hyalella azteca]